ncbi:gephyrin-like molybdotransferase Glp [Nocardioides sp. Kera G14]|uniref:molybdotransferase-like divisome protein Glp n=1 Tax=Nocardioides sp. Kera G14 TaxID=2884264 RepID=UPI001D109363|nr:gephyrin-like molybdotransferase Glp [Nocardioides sp. Kera G14]UDY24103.1 molybdopterin molybdotransferase MoeA [Nocardioides sp. Kera G14]
MPDTSPLSVEEYRDKVLADLTPLAAYPMPLLETLGLAAATDVTALVSLPGFDNSSMDGYAVAWRDVATASEGSPVVLPVVGENAAGAATLLALPPRAAGKIMTGAPLPVGADTVVPYEWTDRGVASVTITQAPSGQGQHVRREGDDVRRDDLILSAGTILGPRQLGLLAATGHASVPARPRPRVVVLSTGSELREPGRPLGPDSIHDSNSFLLAAAAKAAGAIAYRVGIVPDEPDAFLEALDDQLVRADLVVTSGGVSAGDYDVVKEALAPRGVWFGPVAMQPGKPQGFGYVGADREDPVPVFALPGNPVSAYVSFQLFVRPALRRLMGVYPEAPTTATARLTEPVSSMPGRRQFLRGVLGSDAADGPGRTVSVAGGAASHLLGDLAVATCLIVIPEEVTALPEGAEVEVLAFDD